MDPALVFTTFWLYTAVVFFVKRYLYPWKDALGSFPREPWHTGHECTIFFSPDYWWALRFKRRLAAAAPRGQRAALLKHYVVSNNRMNVFFSLAVAVLCGTGKELWPESIVFLISGIAAVMRFISRSFEIVYAFGSDVFQTSRTSTGLRKEERVRLALLSYFEIYVYSAAAYTLLPAVPHVWDALILALNVGTLTNVGYAYSVKDAGLPMNIVFVQVFATLSLVVLSLAAYLSRRK